MTARYHCTVGALRTHIILRLGMTKLRLGVLSATERHPSSTALSASIPAASPPGAIPVKTGEYGLDCIRNIGKNSIASY